MYHILCRARKKLLEISSDAEQWLRRMLCFDPLHRYFTILFAVLLYFTNIFSMVRCLVLELLTSSMFEPFVEKKGNRNAAKSRDAVKRGQPVKVHTASYMHYFRPEADGGDRLLPML